MAKRKKTETNEFINRPAFIRLQLRDFPNGIDAVMEDKRKGGYRPLPGQWLVVAPDRSYHAFFVRTDADWPGSTPPPQASQ